MTSNQSGGTQGEEIHVPYYWKALDWEKLTRDYPPPPMFSRTTGALSPDGMRELQNARFLERVGDAWKLPFYRNRWRAVGLEPGDIKSIDDIVKIPTFTSDDLRESISDAPPFGAHHPPIATGEDRIPLKIHTSGGTTGFPRATLFDPLDMEVQGIQVARALFAQTARPGDLVQITYTLSLANAGWCAFTGAFNWLGCIPLTTGSGNVTPSERQLEYAKAFGTTNWFARGDYLARLTQVADDTGFDLHQLKTKALHTFLGPDVDGSRRKLLQDAWGAKVFDNYGTHEVGHICFECTKGRRHISEDTVYVELCEVESGKPLPLGSHGDVVVTSLHRSVPPIIRYNLRDLMVVYPAARCECGLCTRTMSVFLGRSDEMVKVRGTNVYPLACQSAISKEPRATDEYICIAYYEGEGLARREEMLVRVERRSSSVDAMALAEDLAKALHVDLGVRVQVEIVEPGSLKSLTDIPGSSGKDRRLLDWRKTGEKPPQSRFRA
jgi:phenylacetate-CoA ligase